MGNLTFKTNLVPGSTQQEFALGSAEQTWKIYGLLTGTASNAINAREAIHSQTSNFASLATTASFATTALNAEQAYNSQYTNTATYSGYSGYTVGSLQIGPKIYNGSTTVVVGIADLGLSTAISFLGVVTDNIRDGDKTTPVHLVAGSTTAPTNGNVVLVKSTGEEYVWSEDQWQSLGLATSYALANHTHGNIANNGIISNDSITIANNDALIIADNSDNNKLVASNTTFGTSTTTFLRNDGTWQVPTNTTYSAGTGITLTNTTFSHTIPTSATAGTLGSSTARYYIKTITTDKFGHVTGVTTGNETVTNSDTKNTAGSTNSTSKLYLVGATSQATSAVTYSHSAVYATGGQLDANKVRVGEHVTLQYNTTTNALDFVFV